MKAKNYIGVKSGALEAYEFSHMEKNRSYWKCKCECGGKKIVCGKYLMNGHVRSCGCWKSFYGYKHHLFKGYGELGRNYWTNIQTNAQKSNREFSITIEYGWNLFLQQERKCALSGILLEFGSEKRKDKKTSASLDRIDSSKGYIEGNVQWVHKDVNRMKTDYNQEYFVNICKKISNHSKKQSQKIISA